MTMENDLVERLLEPVTLSGMQSNVEVYQRVIVQRSEAASRIQALEAELACARNGALEEAALRCDAWSTPAALKLAAGEMTAQELRTALAVARGLAAAIRSLARAALTEQS